MMFNEQKRKTELSIVEKKAYDDDDDERHDLVQSWRINVATNLLLLDLIISSYIVNHNTKATNEEIKKARKMEN